MLPDARYVTVEDAAKQIKVQPITLRRWLGIGTISRGAYSLRIKACFVRATITR
jgi:hypothetical protein